MTLKWSSKYRISEWAEFQAWEFPKISPRDEEISVRAIFYFNCCHLINFWCAPIFKKTCQITAKFKNFREMSDNFFMRHVEIWFLVISAIDDFTNFLQRYRNLPMNVAYINSYRNVNLSINNPPFQKNLKFPLTLVLFF